VRSDNSIKYVSPSFSGLTASLYYAGKQTKAVDSTASATANAVKQTSFGGLGAYDMVGTTELGLNYANGPLAASFSTLKQDYKDVGTGTTDQTVNTLGANYAFGAAKLFGLYQTNKTNTSSINNKAMSISATYTMGAVVLMAQAGSLENAAGLKSKLMGLGADYNLSKRTAVYFRAETIDDKAGAMNAGVNPGTIANAADAKFGRTAVGVRHAF
jgi:predicted porin